jgi:hypothetical protein
VFRWRRGWGNIAEEDEQGLVMVDQAQMLAYTLLVTKDIFFIVVCIIGYLLVVGTHADGALRNNNQRQVVLYTHYEELGVPAVHRPAFWFFLNATYRHYVEKEQGECMVRAHVLSVPTFAALPLCRFHCSHEPEQSGGG